MIFIKRTKTAPEILDIEKRKANGSYNKGDVKSLLYKDFYEKCYICGVKPLQDGGEIEHLVAHKGDLDKKFDWENLFLSCGHCNGIKNKKEYSENVINCTKINPNTQIKQVLSDNSVCVELIDANIQSETTAKLIEECFNAESTITRKKASTYRLDVLKSEMGKFYSVILKYKKSQKSYYKKQIEAMLQDNTKFTAFKRDYIIHNKDFSQEFANCF